MSQSLLCDSVAQLVEHLTFNQRVVGSSPTGITILFNKFGNNYISLIRWNNAKRFFLEVIYKKWLASVFV